MKALLFQELSTEYEACGNAATITKDDIAFLLENTDFDEYDIREWFREFLKVFLIKFNVMIVINNLSLLIFRTVLMDS